MNLLDDATLVAFVDDELDAAAALEVRRALAHDPGARERVRLLRLSATLVHAAFQDPSYQRVPPHLVMEAPAALAGRRPAAATRWRLSLPLAASIAVAALLGFGGGFAARGLQPPPTPDFTERLADEVADYHAAYAREDEHLVEVPADRREHIEAWLGQRLKRQLRVPDLSGWDLAFQGARLLVVDGRPVAQLLYTSPDGKQQPLGVCISFGAEGTEAVQTETREGVNLALWRRDGYTYVLAGWMDKESLRALAAELAPVLDRG